MRWVEIWMNLKNSTNLNQTKIKLGITNKEIFTLWSRSVFRKSNVCLFVSGLLLWSTCFGCSCLRYDQQMTPSAGIYARTGTRRERSWGFVCVLRAFGRGRDDTHKRWCGGGFFFFFFLLVNKEEGNLPARRTLTHIPSPGLLFFISLTSSSYP